MSNVVPVTTGLDPAFPGRWSDPRLIRKTGRALARLEARTALRLAAVEADGVVQTAKAHELDHLTREAISGQAMLRRWADHLAGNDPLLADELHLFTDLAKLGKAEIIADTVSDFCREGR